MFSKKSAPIAASAVALALMLAVTTLTTQAAVASTDRKIIDNHGIDVADEATFTNEIVAYGIMTERTGIDPMKEYTFTDRDGDQMNEPYTVYKSGERVSEVAGQEIIIRPPPGDMK